MQTKRYVLFDWDNTIRNGYTLDSWVYYLCRRFVLPSDLWDSLKQIKKAYEKKSITHDQYAEIACSQYMLALKDVRYDELRCFALEYLPYDREYLFYNIVSLFNKIYENDIDIIIVSGAPSIILELYKDDFHIKRIFALDGEVIDGAFSGKVKCNYGFDKQSVVHKIIDQYGNFPFMAFGDSTSDIPMLEHALYAFSINNIMDQENYKCLESKNILAGVIECCPELLQ